MQMDRQLLLLGSCREAAACCLYTGTVCPASACSKVLPAPRCPGASTGSFTAVQTGIFRHQFNKQ